MQCPFCEHLPHPNKRCGKIMYDNNDPHLAIVCRCATGKAVIEDIATDVLEGNAPIYTRNDLVRLLTWYNEQTGDGAYLFATLHENEQAVHDFVKTIGGE